MYYPISLLIGIIEDYMMKNGVHITPLKTKFRPLHLTQSLVYLMG
jgi:hypothetical protein